MYVNKKGCQKMSAPNIGQKDFTPEKISGDIVNKKITELDENSEISIFNILELNKYDKENKKDE